MTRYVVKIDERFIHTFTVEAASKEEALDMGYQLLRDGMTPEEEAERDYDFESGGFASGSSAWEE